MDGHWDKPTMASNDAPGPSWPAHLEPTRTRVLVIDDDPRLGKVLVRMLARDHEVLVLTSAQEALDRIAAGARFDLVLCDLIMPRMTGVDFHDSLCVIAADLVERVVFITAGGFTPQIEAFLRQPSIRWLDKPFPPPEELRRVVREHIVRSARGRSPR